MVYFKHVFAVLPAGLLALHWKCITVNTFSALFMQTQGQVEMIVFGNQQHATDAVNGH